MYKIDHSGVVDHAIAVGAGDELGRTSAIARIVEDAAMTSHYPTAPELQVSKWLNTEAPITLASLRGRVVLLHVFQMLCPGCVTHGIPQTVRAWQWLDPQEVAVIGLHSVFEHHEVMTPQALHTYVSEFRLRFPIGIDAPRAGERIPATMHALQLQGTPSIVLLDRQGRVRLHHLGQIEDLRLGVLIGQLIAEREIEVSTPGE